MCVKAQRLEQECGFREPQFFGKARIKAAFTLWTTDLNAKSGEWRAMKGCRHEHATNNIYVSERLL